LFTDSTTEDIQSYKKKHERKSEDNQKIKIDSIHNSIVNQVTIVVKKIKRKGRKDFTQRAQRKD